MLKNLMHAVHEDDLGRVRLLLDRGANVNATTNFGTTVLHEATSDGYLEMVRLLLDKGADINAADSRGMTALLLAGCHLEMVRLLLDKGADINAADSNGRTALINAVYREDHEMVRFLLDRGADINMTALQEATRAGDLEIVRLLLDRGADNENGSPPLIEATRMGDIEVNFEKYTVRELKALWKERDMRGYSKLRKEELIDGLKSARRRTRRRRQSENTGARRRRQSENAGGRLSAKSYYKLYGDKAIGDVCDIRGDGEYKCLVLRRTGVPYWAKKTRVARKECQWVTKRCKE